MSFLIISSQAAHGTIFLLLSFEVDFHNFDPLAENGTRLATAETELPRGCSKSQSEGGWLPNPLASSPATDESGSCTAQECTQLLRILLAVALGGVPDNSHDS